MSAVRSSGCAYGQSWADIHDGGSLIAGLRFQNRSILWRPQARLQEEVSYNTRKGRRAIDVAESGLDLLLPTMMENNYG